MSPAAVDAEMAQARTLLSNLERQRRAKGRRADALRSRLLALWAAKLERLEREARAAS